MERFVRAAVGGQSSSSRAAEPGVDSGPRGGGGGQRRTSRAAEPGEEPCVDLEVSSNNSGETLVRLARWCVARAHSVCRRVARVLAVTTKHEEQECQKSAGKLHLQFRQGGRGNQVLLPTETVQENARQKAQGVLAALRERAESTDLQAERQLSALAARGAPRAKALYQLGLRVCDPTVSQKTFRRALADLGLAKAPKRP